MPCCVSNRSLAILHFSGSPTMSGTMWLSRGRLLMALALPVRCLEMPDRGRRRRADRGGQGGGEDEAGRVGADGVDEIRRSADIAAEAAERLGKRPLDDV